MSATMPLGYQYLRIVLSRWKLVAGLVLGCTLGGWLFSTLVLARNPSFESAARLNIVPTSEELGYANRFVRGSTFDGGSVLLQTYAEFAHTQPIVGPIVDRYIRDQAHMAGKSEAAWVAANSQPPSFSPSRLVATLNYGEAPRIPLRQDLIESLIKNTTIQTVEGTYLLRIGVEWDDPQSAAWFANALTDAIVARAERMSRTSGTQIAGSLENRLLAKQAELADVLRRSRGMKASIGVVDLDRQKQALIEAQMAEQSRLTSDRADLQSNEAQVAGLRRQAGGKLSSAQAVLEQTLAIEGPKASGLKDGIAIRQGRIGQIGSQIAMLGRNEIAIKTLDDQATALQTEVAALTERVSFSQTENLANAPRIQLVERASPPVLRSSPKTLFNTVLGFVAGCALAACALLLLGEAAPRVRGRQDRDASPDVAGPSPPADRLVDDAPVFGAAIRPQAQNSPNFAGPPRPSFRVWRAAGKGLVRRSVIAAGNLAVKMAPDFGEADSRSPTPQPLRIVSTDSADVPAAAVDQSFPAILPRPANGIAYRGEEVAGYGRAIADWLAGSLTVTGRPLLIVASDMDMDARRVYQLLHDHLQQRGVRVRTLDGSTHPLRGIGRDDRCPMIYGGGFGETGRVAVLREIDDDVSIVLVVAVHADDDVGAALDRASRAVAGMAQKQPYAIAITG